MGLIVPALGAGGVARALGGRAELKYEVLARAVINDARVSDVQLTHDFYASSAARRLRVDEGRKIVAEGIAQRESDIDVVYVYGYGFPAWRGGPMHYAAAAGL